ncbi:DUF4249 family protein [Capnocytophaga sp.]|uniref:DUF4249 family protein n=1 Tax=Capnocytophaga sp. TaxID=44737 RepID=UPI0026DDB0D2|nr:DUF4249 family protein [Capnocytophaga sp.]MDO5104541.1 DUF4249 family protein [Capnocytophaga sp.]
MMKKKFYVYCFLLMLLASCEEVIDVNLDSQAQMLVIDARIDWKKGENKAYPVVHLTHTRDYYHDAISKPVRGAVVKIIAENGKEFALSEMSFEAIPYEVPGFYFDIPFGVGGSFYVCKEEFIPALNQEYELRVDFQGESYTAKATMHETATIDVSRAEQNNNGGFLGDKIEVKFFFDGIENEENNYLVKMNDTARDELFTLDDKFLARKKFFFTTLGLEHELKVNDTIKMSLYRISPDYMQIAKLLRSVAISDGGGRGGPPSYTVPTRVYGNIVNTKDATKNPLGAFRVSQYSQEQYIIK